MIRKYHNHKLQTTLWHREEELLSHHETPGRQIKQNLLSVENKSTPCHKVKSYKIEIVY